MPNKADKAYQRWYDLNKKEGSFCKMQKEAQGAMLEEQVGQRVGRILRLGSGKERVYVYDFQDHNSTFLYKHAKARMKLYKQENYPIIDI